MYEQRAAPLQKAPGPTEDEAARRKRMLLQIRKLALVAVVVGVLGTIAVFGAWMALRDTWEADHRDEILAMEKQASESLAADQLENAEIEYAKLLALIGIRKIQDPELAEVIGRAKRAKQDIETALKERKAREYFQANSEAISGGLTRAASAIEQEQFNHAIAELEKVIRIIQRSPHVIGRLADALGQAERQQHRAERLRAEVFVRGIRELAKAVKAAADRNEFAQAMELNARLLKMEKASAGLGTFETARLAEAARVALRELPLKEKEYRLKQQARDEARDEVLAKHRVPFQDGSGLWGYKDGLGKVAIKPRWPKAGKFFDGLAVVQWPTPSYPGVGNDILATYGYINMKGVPAIADLYHWASDFSDGKAKVQIREYWAAYHPKVTVTGPGRLMVKRELLPVPRGQRPNQTGATFAKGLFYRTAKVRDTVSVTDADGRKFVVAKFPFQLCSAVIDKTGKVISATRKPAAP